MKRFINRNRLKFDFQFIFLNYFVNRIPIWFVRRWIYLKCGMKIGKGARVGIGTVVYSPNGITIGNRTIINEFCCLDGRGGLHIDNDVGVSIYTKIITATHDANSRDFKYVTGSVRIFHHVWIGAGATILNNTTLRAYTVIGAGSVYKGCSSPRDIIVGNPGKVIKKRDDNLDYKIDYEPYFR